MWVCSAMSSSPSPSPSPITKNALPLSTTANYNKQKQAILAAFISGGLLISSPCIASSSIGTTPSPSSADLLCRDEEEKGERRIIEEQLSKTAPQLLTNQSIVDDAWQIVNDSFLDASDRHKWSPQFWMVIYTLLSLTKPNQTKRLSTYLFIDLFIHTPCLYSFYLL